MKILVCDDRSPDALSVARRLKDAAQALDVEADITVFSKIENETASPEEAAAIASLKDEFGATDLKSAIEQLFRRAEVAIESGAMPPEPIAFDGFDMAFIDSNLSYLHISGARHTADTIAGPLRAFSSTAYLISINGTEFDFDLQYLIGDPRTVADFGVRAESLDSAWLWKRVVGDFCPWYWPELSNAPSRRKAQIDVIKANLDHPIIDLLGVPSAAFTNISRSAVARLSPEVDDPRDDLTDISAVTFRLFFQNACRSLPPTDRNAIASFNEGWVTEVIARVAAAEIENWLRREILGPQDVLVDVPHLVARMPFLLGPEEATPEQLQAVVTGTTPPFGMLANLYSEHIGAEGRAFASEPWLDRPAFWWPLIADSGAVTKLAMEYGRSFNFVFLEDLSTYERLSDTEFEPKEFVAKLDSPWDRRYVKQVAGLRYAPKSSFAV